MSETTPATIIREDSKEIKELPDTAYPNIKSTVTLFFITILFWIIVAIAGSIIFMNTPRELPSVRSVFKLLINAAPILLIINYALKKSKKQQGFTIAINYNKIQGWLIPILIIAAPAFSIIIEPTSAWIPMPKSIREIFERVFAKDIFSMISVIIVAPVVEEILCRGIVLNGLLKNYSPQKAIITSAVFFSLMHLNPWQAIPAFFGGLFLGWIYYKTQSVITGIIFHTAINTTGYIFLFLGSSKQHISDIFGGMYYPVFAVSFIAFVVISLIIHKKAKAISREQPNL